MDDRFSRPASSARTVVNTALVAACLAAFTAACNGSVTSAADAGPPDLAGTNLDWPAGGPIILTTVAAGPAGGGATMPVSFCLIFTDLDGDERPDIFLLPQDNTLTNGYLLHNVDGKRFEESLVPVGTLPVTFACTSGDYDNDGRQDIFITSAYNAVLLHNDGNLKFTNVIRPNDDHGIDPVKSSARTVAFLDYDADGKLDLYLGAFNTNIGPMQMGPTCDITKENIVCHGSQVYNAPKALLYHNTDGSHFELISEAAQATNAPDVGRPNAVSVVDWNFDGYPDLFDADDFTANHFYLNRAGSFFENITATVGMSSGDNGINNGMGAAFGDFDGDGLLDVYLAETGPNQFWFGQRVAPGMTPTALNRAFDVGTGPVTLTHVDWAPSAADFNNDGWLDLFVPSAAVLDSTSDFLPLMTMGMLQPMALQSDTIFVNQGGALSFNAQVLPHEPAHQHGIAQWDIAATAVADYDGDGALDVAEIYQAGAFLHFRLLHNETAKIGRSLSVKLVGTRSNKSGVGATITLTVGTHKQIRQVQGTPGSLGKPSDTQLFGLGAAMSADHITVLWPGGATQEVSGPFAASTTVIVTEE